MNIGQKSILISENFYERPYEIITFGNYGFVLMMFPTQGDNFNNSEEGKIVDLLADFISEGFFRIVFVPTINNFFWGEERSYSREKSKILYDFNNFLVGEVITYLYKIIGRPTPIITIGCGEQAGFFAANCFFRRPDLFYGMISIDGVFDILKICSSVDESDSNIYFNNPISFLPNLNDDYWLIHMKTGKDINIIASSGNSLAVEQANLLSTILTEKSIEHYKRINEKNGAEALKTYPEIIKNLVEERFK